MKRSTKVWIGIGVLAVAGVTLSIASRPGKRFSETVSFLHNLRPITTKTVYQDWTHVFPTIKVTISETEEFLIDADLASVGQMAKKELKPRSSGFASVLDNDYRERLVYAFPFKGASQNVLVHILYKDPTHTTVTVNTTRQANWLDKTSHWFGGLFGRKEPDKPVSFGNL